MSQVTTGFERKTDYTSKQKWGVVGVVGVGHKIQEKRTLKLRKHH